MLGMGLAAWLIGGVLVELAGRIKLFRAPLGDSLRRALKLPRSAYGMSLAHLGVGLVVIGITASSSWQTEKIQVMRFGDSVDLAGYSVTLDGVEKVQGPNYSANRARFTVTWKGAYFASLFPERRTYPVEQRQTTEAAIYTTGFADLYAVIGDSDSSGGWVTRLYHNPLVPFIWIGAVVMALGGGLSLSDRRHRVGAPSRRRRTPAIPPDARPAEA